MKKLQYIMFAIFAVVFTACEQEVEYDATALDNFIVLNAQFADGNNPSCQVSRSNTIFGDVKNGAQDIVYLPDAKVTASCGGKNYSFSVFDNEANMVGDGLVLKAGETYTIHATCEGLKPVSATVTVPNKPEGAVKFVKRDSVSSYYYDEVFYFDVSVIDNPNAVDYYQLGAYRIVEVLYKDGSTELRRDSLPVSSKDPIMNWNNTSTNLFGEEDESVNSETNIYRVFNDGMFNGQTATFRVQVSITSYLYDTVEDVELKAKGATVKTVAVVFDLRHISHATYMYYSSLAPLVRGEDFSMSPTILNCNVDGGAGIVAAWSSAFLKCEIEE